MLTLLVSWKNGLADFHEIFRVCLSCKGQMLCKFSYPTELFNMFKIGFENRDFCKSLHFYIVDTDKQFFQSLKMTLRSILALYACFTGLLTSLAGIAGLLSCSRPFGPRASPEGRCPQYFFLVLRGACQRPDLYITALVTPEQEKTEKYFVAFKKG